MVRRVTAKNRYARALAAVTKLFLKTRKREIRTSGSVRDEDGQHPHPLGRRQFLQLVAGAVALPVISRFAWAQAYPTRPITMIVPYPAGGLPDAVGRVMAERMRAPLGQPIIIENVSGAEGSIGTGRAARARPDGYTIVNGTTGSHVLSGALYSLPYDLLNDFAPIVPLGTAQLVLFARKAIPANDLRELITWLRVNPDKASAGIYAAGPHLVTAFFQKETGTRFALVPYRGGSAIYQDLIGGQIDLLVGTPDQLPLVRAGSMKAYAVTGETRSALAPDIPTFAEMGLPALSYSAWGGLFAPRGTPRDVIGKLNASAVEVLTEPVVRSRLADLGMEVFPRERQTPEALGATQKADIEKWWPFIKFIGIRAQDQ
jgi:tripartite-type tricarboxylate transporter receptor subunit TctC